MATGRCVVIADCLGDVDELRAALARHVVRGGEAYLVHVVAAAELEPGEAAMLATDPEHPELKRPLVAATRAAYRAQFDAFRAQVAHAMRADGVQVLEVRDDEPSETAIRRIARPPEARR